MAYQTVTLPKSVAVYNAQSRLGDAMAVHHQPTGILWACPIAMLVVRPGRKPLAGTATALKAAADALDEKAKVFDNVKERVELVRSAFDWVVGALAQPWDPVVSIYAGADDATPVVTAPTVLLRAESGRTMAISPAAMALLRGAGAAKLVVAEGNRKAPKALKYGVLAALGLDDRLVGFGMPLTNVDWAATLDAWIADGAQPIPL